MFLSRENNISNSATKRKEIDLWESICLGERKALDHLFRLYYSPLFDYGIKLISNEDQVKDAIQELFFKLWKKHTSLSTPESIKAYLLVSLRRIMLRRRESNRNRYERNRKYIDDMFTEDFSREDLLIRSEIDQRKNELMVQAINQLNGRQKETLFLRYYHGLTNKEISKVMRINHQSVKNNLYRALKNVRGMVESVPDSI